MFVIGVISDTHGLLRPEAVQALRGCDQILHAGDVGRPEILVELRKVAPVTAVRGNVDCEAWADALPETEVLQAGDEMIYMRHNLEELPLDPRAAGFRVVVSGHTHRARSETKNGVLYLNPGSAGPRRFGQPVTLARLVIAGGRVEAEVIELES
jgi:putative phosphoesterase